jgi:hypothetical protein
MKENQMKDMQNQIGMSEGGKILQIFNAID